MPMNAGGTLMHSNDSIGRREGKGRGRTRLAEIETARGRVHLPAYMPVTTFGKTYPVDRLIQPFLPRFADMMMVAYHWARRMPETERPVLPVFVDSGGFACLLPGNVIETRADGTACIVCSGSEAVDDDDHDGRDENDQRSPQADTDEDALTYRITPEGVLALQNSVADFGSTLDFPIPVNGLTQTERMARVDWTLANARWASQHESRCARMFGSVQGWDPTSYEACAREMVGMGYKDLAIGGLVPRMQDRPLVIEVCRVVQKLVPPGGLLHAFGVGDPEVVRTLFDVGVTSTDSSSYVRSAVSGRRWDGGDTVDDPTPLERAHAALMNLQYAKERVAPQR